MRHKRVSSILFLSWKGEEGGGMGGQGVGLIIKFSFLDIGKGLKGYYNRLPSYG